MQLAICNPGRRTEGRERIAEDLERLMSKHYIGSMCFLVLGAQYNPTVPVQPPQVMRISMGSRSTNNKSRKGCSP